MPTDKRQPDGSNKLAAYEEEIRRSRLRTLIGAVALFVLTAFFIMIVSGPVFDPVLRIFGIRGIRNSEGGVYTDCSLPENKDISYCQPKGNAEQKKWDNLKQGGEAPFTLHGD